MGIRPSFVGFMSEMGGGSKFQQQNDCIVTVYQPNLRWPKFYPWALFRFEYLYCLLEF